MDPARRLARLQALNDLEHNPIWRERVAQASTDLQAAMATLATVNPTDTVSVARAQERYKAANATLNLIETERAATVPKPPKKE